MGLSRRFLNLIVDNGIVGGKSLCRIDLRRHKLFNTTIPVPVLPLTGNRPESEWPQDSTACDDNHQNKIRTSPLPAPSINFRASAKGYSTETCLRKLGKTTRSAPVSTPESSASNANDHNNYKQAATSITRKIQTIQLPDSMVNFRCSCTNLYWYLDCLPLAGQKLLCADSYGRTVLFDVSTRQVETIPYLRTPKCSTLCCFVPLPSSADAPNDNGSIYIMEGKPCQELQGSDVRQQLSYQFEAFVYQSKSKSWQSQLLPPAPFICDPKHFEHGKRPDITSYTVVEHGGSHVVCISADGAGTYCLDTVTHNWSKVGDWMLPFIGKVEYVPELKLWFGISTKDLQLAAADLSTMDFQPQLVGTWKELDAPKGWTELLDPQLVNMGSGRFCVSRFFHALNPMTSSDFDESDDPAGEEYFTILTGIDVVPCIHDGNGTTFSSSGNGSKAEKVGLQMIKHNSRRHMSYGTGSDGNIEVVF